MTNSRFILYPTIVDVLSANVIILTSESRITKGFQSPVPGVPVCFLIESGFWHENDHIKKLIKNRAASIITEAALSLLHRLLSTIIFLPVSFLFLGIDFICLNQQAVDLLIPEDSSEKSIIP